MLYVRYEQEKKHLRTLRKSRKRNAVTKLGCLVSESRTSRRGEVKEMKKELMCSFEEPCDEYEPLPEPVLGDFLNIELFVKAMIGGYNN